MAQIKQLIIGFVVILLFSQKSSLAQPVPALEENIPFLVTFSKQAESKWGDDDFCQVFFFQIPQDFKDPIYLRVFDPDCGGQHDEMNVTYNSLTKYSVYGGIGCISDEDARDPNPIGNYKSGNLLATKTFGIDTKYDNNWYTFGPFNPSEGELSKKYGGYVFKLICEGIKGDDGNLYRYYMTTKPNTNISVEGGNAFTFEYTFRLHSDPWQTSHVYPYIDDKVVSLMQSNFDWDNDGYIRLFSISSLGTNLSTSGDNNWTQNVYRVTQEEKGKSMDIQFTKDDKNLVNNNNVVFYLTNQYGDLLPFYTVPLGGLHTPKGNMKITEQKKK
ncbi:MAG: hypothetical protein SGI87_01095 [Flavobacteriales bacterium]|nr:hypothetical protein [Flavobacteriales bacterium]